MTDSGPTKWVLSITFHWQQPLECSITFIRFIYDCSELTRPPYPTRKYDKRKRNMIKKNCDDTWQRSTELRQKISNVYLHCVSPLADMNPMLLLTQNPRYTITTAPEPVVHPSRNAVPALLLILRYYQEWKIIRSFLTALSFYFSCKMA